MRKVIIWLSQYVSTLLYKKLRSDPHCGYRVWRITSLQHIRIQAKGMHYANEINQSIQKY